MKITVTRILTAALAATLVLLSLLSFAACGKKSDKPAEQPLPPDAQDKMATIIEFVKSNQAALEDVVKYVRGQEGLSYYYFINDSQGQAKIEQLTMTDGVANRTPVENSVLSKLAATRFTGELTYSPNGGYSVVSFYTYMSGNGMSHLFVYCPTEEDVAYLTGGFLRDAESVTTAPIVGRWYYVGGR